MDIKDDALHRVHFRNDEDAETVRALVDRIRELEAELAALRKQQSEPVAWMYVNNDGECEQIDYGNEFADLEDFEPLYREAAPKQQGEPVAEVVDGNLGPRLVWLYPDLRVPAGTKLYREAAPRVPEGWQLVPKEPTKEMKEAYKSATVNFDNLTNNAYRAMLAAALEPKDKEKQ